ncbi:hypothetical protein DDI_4184 [Dickeya dianthicola RNS04.9]|nr:hypothetical protein DDI_4184 [Dickeya dianthicola RNS04.9]
MPFLRPFGIYHGGLLYRIPTIPNSGAEPDADAYHHHRLMMVNFIIYQKIKLTHRY